MRKLRRTAQKRGFACAVNYLRIFVCHEKLILFCADNFLHIKNIVCNFGFNYAYI